MMSAEDDRVGQVIGRRSRPLPAAAPETSGFSQTCNLLSQFLKGKGGSLKDISPQIATQLEEKPKPKDYNCTKEIKLGNPPKLLLIEEEEEKKMTPMTIFYAGKVTVFYHLSPEKANHLLTTLAHQQFTPPQSPTADLPIARRVSLHRFLDKRKHRVMAKAPYTTISSPKEL